MKTNYLLICTILVVLAAYAPPVHACYLPEVCELIEEFTEEMRKSVFVSGKLEETANEALEALI